MIMLPAIDIKDGQCVRLVQGDYSTAHKVAESPYETAKYFQSMGAKWIHMVDLDGAKEKEPINFTIVEMIAEETDLNVEVGGGIRDMKTIERYLNAGIKRVILGSVAVKNPQLVKESIKEFGEKIAVGIDAKNEFVATEGWIESSTIHYLELAKRMEDVGVSTIIYTDISRDGTLQGVNERQLQAINEAVGCQIIASGGVKSIEDIVVCNQLSLYGCICGKAIYSKQLDLKEAIEKAGKQQ